MRGTKLTPAIPFAKPPYDSYGCIRSALRCPSARRSLHRSGTPTVIARSGHSRRPSGHRRAKRGIRVDRGSAARVERSGILCVGRRHPERPCPQGAAQKHAPVAARRPRAWCRQRWRLGNSCVSRCLRHRGAIDTPALDRASSRVERQRVRTRPIWTAGRRSAPWTPGRARQESRTGARTGPWHDALAARGERVFERERCSR